MTFFGGKVKTVNFRWILVGFICCLTAKTLLLAQSSLRPEDLQGLAIHNDSPEMLFKYMLGQVAQASEKRLVKLNAIQTESDFREWQQANRRRFLELIGGLPSERTALNPQVVGEFARDRYRVRKVIFEKSSWFLCHCQPLYPHNRQRSLPRCALSMRPF